MSKILEKSQKREPYVFEAKDGNIKDCNSEDIKCLRNRLLMKINDHYASTINRLQDEAKELTMKCQVVNEQLGKMTEERDRIIDNMEKNFKVISDMNSFFFKQRRKELDYFDCIFCCGIDEMLMNDEDELREILKQM